MGIARQIRLRVARTVARLLAAHLRRVIVAVVKAIVTAHVGTRTAAFRPVALVVGIVLAELFLRGGDQAIVMLGVLLIVFGRDRVAGGVRIAG